MSYFRDLRATFVMRRPFEGVARVPQFVDDLKQAGSK
jgi:hypothetical protein